MAFTDNFTDDNGVDLDAHTPSGGTAWTKVLDGNVFLEIYSNALSIRTAGGTGESFYTCDDQGSANHYVQIKDIGAFENVVIGDNIFRLCARLVDESNHIAWYMGGTGAVGSALKKYVADVATSLVGVQGADEDVIRIECNGTDVELYIDEVQQGTTQTVEEHQAETSIGMYVNAAQGNIAVYDDFEAGVMAAAPPTLSRIPIKQHHYRQCWGN